MKISFDLDDTLFISPRQCPVEKRFLFRCYGIHLDFVINGSQHDMDVQRMQQESMPSKYPSHYRIDLHVDDDISVAQNGQIYGFRVFLMKNQENRTDLLLSEGQHIQK